MAYIYSNSLSASKSVYNSLVASNKGLGGLVTGLDTDSLIEALLSGTRSKIATQTQQRQLLTWKMDAYRGVATTLRSFQSKYFDYANTATNLRSPSFFNVYKAASSSSAVSASAATNATSGTVSIDAITQLATSQTLTTNEYTRTLQGSEIALGGDYADKTLQMTVGSTTKTIKLDSLSGVTDATEFQSRLQGLIDSAFGTTSNGHSVVEVAVDSTGGAARVTLEGGANTVTVRNTVDGLGFAAGDANRLSMSSTIGDLLGDSLAGDSFKFSVNGVEFSVGRSTSISALTSMVSNSTANVRLSFDSIKQTFTFTAKTKGGGNNIELEDIEGNFLNSFVGIQAGGAITGTAYTAASATGGNLAGYIEQLLSVPGSDGEVVAPEDLYDELNRLYLRLEVGGAQSALYTVSDEFKDAVTDLARDYLNGTNPGALDEIADKVVQSYNDQIEGKYGADSGVRFSLDSSGNIVFQSDANKAVSLISYDTEEYNAFSAFGFGAAGGTVSNTALGTGTLLGDLAGFGSGGALTLTVDGTTRTIGYGAGDTLSDFMNAVNSQFGSDILSFADGRLLLNADGGELSFSDSGDLMNIIFGASSYDNAAAADLGSRTTAGTNAEIVVDGQTLYSSTNTFNINGIDITVGELYNKELDSTVDPITVTVTADVDGVIDKIKDWVGEYNTIVELLNTVTREEKVSGYEPLTDEQKADMSESEIEKWETEAKKGLLRSDSTLRGILTQMRTALYTKVESSGFSLYDIGITTVSMTSFDYSKSGQLQIDEDTLRDALEQNPDAVRELFTNSEQGLANKLYSILDDAVRTSSTNQGSLVRIAGTEKITGNNESTLSKKIAAIDELIAKLNTRLTNEYNRYWAKFSSLETAISNLNTQMSYLSSLTGTSSSS